MLNKWTFRGLKLAKEISTWSKDPSTKVGSVILDQNHRVISVGFNGYPKGCNDDGMENREEKYKKVLHSEINAILFAKQDLKNCTIYVYPMPPCCRCAGAIIQSGISSIITLEPSPEQYERWGDDFDIAYKMYQERNVHFMQYSISEFDEECLKDKNNGN
jgi:dCMP deaminase